VDKNSLKFLGKENDQKIGSGTGHQHVVINNECSQLWHLEL